MTITQRLAQLDPSLKIHKESEWSGGHEASFYSAFNDGGVECETGEFLYAFIRLLKPQHVLETGTHFGIGASYMGLALRDNGFGHLDTIEFIPEIRNKAVERLSGLDLLGQVTPHEGDVAQFTPSVEKYQMILLDTEPQTRFAELIKFYPYLNVGGYVFIHDLHRHMHQIPNEEHGFAWPYGPIPEEIKQLVREDKLRPFHFPTPRGLTGFYKVAEQDYQWK
jgi:predicted O-methyltransferase YrrM